MVKQMSNIIRFERGEKSRYNTLVQNNGINNDTLYFASSENAYELHLGDTKVTDLDNRNMISVTHSELLSLIEETKLIPGMQYRITDYNLICNPVDNAFTEIATYVSAGNGFDIIVVADSESVLNEHARAIQRYNDTYFANSSLAEWELKYCVFNDVERFDWACEEGKGVIYHMKDEFGNVAPYDFKNVKYLFKRNITVSNITSSAYYYTFDMNGTDMSLTPFCSNNVIGSNKLLSGTSYLCYNVFNNDDVDSVCTNNVLMNGCFGNTFGKNCNNNSFGVDCNDNAFGADCNDNTFGNNCDSNVFMEDSDSNHFGNMCNENVLGVQNRFMTFGDECCNNELRVDINGDYMSLCKYIRLDSGCSFVTLYNALPLTDDEDTLQSIHVHRSVIGTYTNRRNVPVQRTNAEYEISVSMNSSNEVKVYCIADLIM